MFITVWAGSWLIWSVTIDRTMAMSSTNFAWYGKKSLTHWPDLPYRLNPVSGPWILSFAP